MCNFNFNFHFFTRDFAIFNVECRNFLELLVRDQKNTLYEVLPISWAVSQIRKKVSQTKKNVANNKNNEIS